MCRRAGIPTITATAVRHRTSTLFWKMDGIDNATVDQLMAHLGHSKEIDQNIYAVPPTEQIMMSVTPIIEKQFSSSNNHDFIISVSF